MPTYSNPNTIDVGTQKSAAEIQSNFDAIQVALNGNLDETNVPNLTAAFTTYKEVWRGSAVISTGSNNYILGPSNPSNLLIGAVGSAPHAFYLDPAQFAANARTTKYALRATVISNAVAPGFTSVTSAMSPVATWGGASGNLPSVATTGAQVVSAAPAVPGVSAATTAFSADVNAPAAGPFCVFCAPGGTQTTGNVIAVVAQLYTRQV